MRRMLLLFAAICTLGAVQLHAQQPRFHVLAFYSNHEEPDHVGYNDDSTHWPWFVHFLGTVFYSNSWPPLPAVLRIDDRTHPLVKGLPASYLSPANEWYIWQPDPRSNHDIKVLLTLDPSNYPLGMKDTLVSGDLPVVWTNTKYRMLYMNMGHGDKNFTSPTQNRLFENAVLWLGAGQKQNR
jgi:type 1 glutamine amidotransferase